MSEFPVGWFYIQCPTRQDQVLTVPNMATQPSVRVELRPNKKGDHQLWCYHKDGYLVNKHSGCVLGVERDKFKEQCIYQSKRSSALDLTTNDPIERQIWKYDLVDKKLVLTDQKKRPFYLNDLTVPKLEEDVEKGCSWLLYKNNNAL